MQKSQRVVLCQFIVSLGAIVTSVRPASALAPCTDGSLFGTLTPFYQAILGDDDRNGVLDPGETPSSYYQAMPPTMQRMVRCGANPERTVPDLVLYRERPASRGGLVRDAQGRVVGRVYDHLDPVTRRYHLAVALRGCFTDNAFGRAGDSADAAYLASVFWPGDRTHADLESAPPLRLGFRCEDDEGRTVLDYAPAGIALDLISRAENDAPNAEPTTTDWVTQVETAQSPTFPPAVALAHGTSAWWNVAMRGALGDPEVADAMRETGVENWDLTASDAEWKSPFDDPALLFGRLGWGSSWFADRFLWEWSQVYEASLDAGSCGGTPDDWVVTVTLDPLAVGKPRNGICGDERQLGSLTVIKDSVPDDPWDRYDFVVSGPVASGFTLQDPGANECPGDPLCTSEEDSAAFRYPDRATRTALIASPSLGGIPYRVRELDPRPGHTVGWECKNAPMPLAPTCDPENAAFDFDACVEVASPCAAAGTDWRDGYISCRQADADFATCAPDGYASETDPFELCAGDHVLCRFTNRADDDNDEACLAAASAAGDLRAIGDPGSFGEGLPSPVTFNAAAVAALSADAADSIFLASFVPLADQSRWPATLDHFVQPLPVVENDEGDLLPDRDRVCAGAEDTACLAWNAAVEILEQAPDRVEVATNRRIGTGSGERRVTYTRAPIGAAVPRALRAFDYAASDPIADERDLWSGLGLKFVAGDPSSEEAARLLAHDVVRRTLTTRGATVSDPATGAPQTLQFLVGDVFHADPVLLGGPANFTYLASDLEGNGRSCIDTARPNKGYRCFFERERRRRKVLLAPSNDGQLHAFDAGFFRGEVTGQRLVGRFDLGTGRELFAHIPRPMLAHTRNMTTLEHAAGLDGPLTVGDVFIDPVHDGNPTAGQREWRTVAIGGYRDGGRGLYALDLTHPDPVQTRKVSSPSGKSAVEFVPVASSSAVPACSALARSLPSGCVRPYPMVLWEFSDPDLGASWSKVNLGRVLVRPSTGGEPVVRFVAVFGGGLDAAGTGRGQFLYMVDVETGGILWKRPVVGAVPSEPAAVDTDGNGLLDTLYVGTTAGHVYKVDLARAGDLDAATGRVENPSQWRPFRVFDAGGRAIFFRPSVIYEQSSGHYAIGFGTGDRSDLWSPAGADAGGRFYLIVDPGWSEGSGTLPSGPLDETSVRQIDAGAPLTGGNLLTDPTGGDQLGWVLRLGDGERVVSDSLAVSGALTFATFEPNRGDGDDSDPCSFGGNGRVYSLLATNADPLGGAQSERAVVIEGLAGPAVITTRGFSLQGAETRVDPFDSEELRGARDTLLDLFPADCRFGNFVLDVSTRLADRELLPLAQIPVCVARKNWTEH